MGYFVHYGSSDAPWKGRWRSGNHPLTLPKVLFLLLTSPFFNNNNNSPSDIEGLLLQTVDKLDEF
jgi:hypothetical protein